MKKSLLVGLLILTSVCFIFGQAKTLDANSRVIASIKNFFIFAIPTNSSFF